MKYLLPDGFILYEGYFKNMTRVSLLVSLFLFISADILGQCANAPTVALSITSGSTCGTTPVTVSGNIFGGSATLVTITENGAGSVSPASAKTSPFTFTYTPGNGDLGKKVIITVTTNNPLGKHCSEAIVTYTLTVNVNLSAPVAGTITNPSCNVSIGSVILNGLPSAGTWSLIRSPGGVTTSGSGTSTSISNLPPGIYTYTVTNSAGCISPLSANIIITAQPGIPAAPIVGTITSPTCVLPTGSVVMNGLPASMTWTLTRYPGTITSIGIGSSITLSGIPSGVYNYTLTSANGCISILSANVVVNTAPCSPTLVITNPAPVCFPSTVDITSLKITSGSPLNLTYTYWADATAKIPFNTPSLSTAGTYYIKGTTTDGSFTVQPVTVTVFMIPLANAGHDQVLTLQSGTTMDAELVQNYETGVWSILSGSGEFFDSTYAKTAVSRLSADKNKFLWTVTNGVCHASFDTVMITVRDHVTPTLITPNMDGKNDFFILKGFGEMSRIELAVFDRRGVLVYKNLKYDNRWNGTDSNGSPLSDDTYFYVLKAGNSNSVSGYLVIRR